MKPHLIPRPPPSPLLGPHSDPAVLTTPRLQCMALLNLLKALTHPLGRREAVFPPFCRAFCTGQGKRSRGGSDGGPCRRGVGEGKAQGRRDGRRRRWVGLALRSARVVQCGV